MDKNMIIRICALAFTLLNLILTVCGVNPIPIADETAYEIISIIVTIAAIAWSTWKNNNFTYAAKLAQKMLDAIKAGKISCDKVEEFLNSTEQLPE